jgi:hypothetical protein
MDRAPSFSLMRNAERAFLLEFSACIFRREQGVFNPLNECGNLRPGHLSFLLNNPQHN